MSEEGKERKQRQGSWEVYLQLSKPNQIWSCRDTVTVQSNYRELDWAAGVTLLQ
ncbi:hypothetical protein PCASD_16612 [Puccinia coronata f. sp. avenae]|uniref:Uncharacterized protein n=1 Tax=Puccinia coronata f. sp. avenae TaxID=200324 RepID=A0A2N5T152_9BASI|nr:hypothetical protein PCASD_16612 [Puccinia coronata f. sp. avenae]